MEPEFDMSELTTLSKGMVEMVTKRWPKDNKRFLRQEGTKERKVAVALARSRLKNLRPASNKASYLGHMKRGKVYHRNGDKTDLTVRTYNNSNHGHLIEDGHVVEPRGKTTGKTAGYQRSGSKPNKRYAGESRTGEQFKETFVPGYHIMRDTERQFTPTFFADMDQHIDDLLDEGLW